MEINSANVYLRSRIMLCFDDEKLKDESTFKGNSQAEYFIKAPLFFKNARRFIWCLFLTFSSSFN